MASDREQPISRRWIFEVVVFGTMGLMLFCMMAGMEPGLYGAGVAGTGASVILGRLSVQRKWMRMAEGIQRFGTLWLWGVGFAALSLLNGKWEPAVFAAVIGLTMTGFYAIGARSGLRREV